MGMKSKAQKIYYFTQFLLTRFKKRRKNEKAVYIELLDFPPNRRLLQIVRLITENGYRCMAHIPAPLFFKMDIYGLIIAREKLVIRARARDMKDCALVITDRPARVPPEVRAAAKVFELRYDLYRADNSGAMCYPILFHPDYHFRRVEENLLSRAPSSERRIAALFVGSVGDNYDKAETKEFFHINTRLETINFIKEHIKADRLFIPKTKEEFYTAFYAGELNDKAVIIESSKFSLRGEEYFDLLLASRFFIYMCGAMWPYCHNQIESMASGAIPVTQFPEIFAPPFEDGKNALAFSTLPDLITLLENICSGAYAESKISAMRNGILDYYKEHLSFDSFKKQVMEADSSQLKIVDFMIDGGGGGGAALILKFLNFGPVIRFWEKTQQEQY
jgi:hypothetical protein